MTIGNISNNIQRKYKEIIVNFFQQSVVQILRILFKWAVKYHLKCRFDCFDCITRIIRIIKITVKHLNGNDCYLN